MRAYERSGAWFAALPRPAGPGPVDMTKLLPVTYVVAGSSSAYVLILIADLVNPISAPA